MDFRDRQGETKKIVGFYDEKRNNRLAEIKNWPAYVGFAVAGISTVASFFTSSALLMVSAIGAGYGIVKLLSNKSAKKSAEAQYQESCRLTERVMDSLFEEYVTFENEFASYDEYEDEINRELEQV